MDTLNDDSYSFLFQPQTPHRCPCSNFLHICDFNHMHPCTHQGVFNSHNSRPTIAGLDWEKKLHCQKWRPYKVRGLFSQLHLGKGGAKWPNKELFRAKPRHYHAECTRAPPSSSVPPFQLMHYIARLDIIRSKSHAGYIQLHP